MNNLDRIVIGEDVFEIPEMDVVKAAELDAGSIPEDIRSEVCTWLFKSVDTGHPGGVVDLRPINEAIYKFLDGHPCEGLELPEGEAGNYIVGLLHYTWIHCVSLLNVRT